MGIIIFIVVGVVGYFLFTYLSAQLGPKENNPWAINKEIKEQLLNEGWEDVEASNYISALQHKYQQAMKDLDFEVNGNSSFSMREYADAFYDKVSPMRDAEPYSFYNISELEGTVMWDKRFNINTSPADLQKLQATMIQEEYDRSVKNLPKEQREMMEALGGSDFAKNSVIENQKNQMRMTWYDMPWNVRNAIEDKWGDRESFFDKVIRGEISEEDIKSLDGI